MTYYFAYGSNMNQEQMKERCPESILTGKAVLEGYKLKFTIYSPKRKCGCADIVKDPKSKVYGLLYTLTNGDLERLDDYEGHPKHYRRITVEVTGKTGRKKSAESYEVVIKAEKPLVPSSNYLSLIIQAANNFKFPKAYIQYLGDFGHNK